LRVQSSSLGLVNNRKFRLTTPIYGYGDDNDEYSACTWPGKTFVTQFGEEIKVKWRNRLPLNTPYLIKSRDGVPVVDESLHWAYSLKGLEAKKIDVDGVPVVTHLHGGHSNSSFDGNPEFFFGPFDDDAEGPLVKGPQYVTDEYTYNDTPDEKAATKVNIAPRSTLLFNSSAHSINTLTHLSSPPFPPFNKVVPRPYVGHYPIERVRWHGRFLHLEGRSRHGQAR